MCEVILITKVYKQRQSYFKNVNRLFIQPYENEMSGQGWIIVNKIV